MLLGLLCLWFYHYCTKQFDEFKKRGMPFAKPSFPFGSRNAKKALMGEVSFFDVDRMLAENEFKDEKIFGYFVMGQPTVVINDEELAKKVLIKDFEHFTDLRPFGYDAETKDAQIVKSMMSNLKGDKWKKIRSIMSPVFASGKLKLMAPHIIKCGEHLEAYIGPIVEQGEEIEARNLASFFTVDSMATAGYGLEINSFANPENTFRRMCLSLVGAPGYGSSMDMARAVFIMTAPGLAKLLGVPMFPKKPAKFLQDIIEKTYRHRIESGERRNDIIDVIVEEMKNNDLSKDFREEDKEIILVAQAFVMFFAGFDSISIGLAMVIHNLVIHQDVQDKLLAEIDNVLEETGGEVTYETVQNMDYLHRVIQESGRLVNGRNYYCILICFSIIGTITCFLAMKGFAPRTTLSLKPTSPYQKAGLSRFSSMPWKMMKKTTRTQNALILIISSPRMNPISLLTRHLDKGQGHVRVK